MNTVSVLSLSQQQMESVVGDGNGHLQGVHHFAMTEEHHHHHQHHHHHLQPQYTVRDGQQYTVRNGQQYAVRETQQYAVRDGQQYTVRDGQQYNSVRDGQQYNAVRDGQQYSVRDGQQYMVRDGQHYVLRDDLQHFAVRENEMQGSQQALMAAAIAGNISVVPPDNHDDHQVNKLELRWTEQGFCDARGDTSTLVKEVSGVRTWEQQIYGDRGETVPVIESNVMEAAHHVVMHQLQDKIDAAETGRWEDPSLCDANDEEDIPNDGEHTDSKRPREVRWTEQALCDALNAVKSGTLTAYKASKDYGIPRSTLRNWLNGRNRSRKRGPRVDEALAFCRQEIQEPAEASGPLLLQSSDVTANSAEEGHISDNDGQWRKRKRAWTKQTLFEALNSVRNGEMSVQKAAQMYGIPNSTLDYWMKEHDKKSATEASTYAQAYNYNSRSEDPYVVHGMEMNEDEDDDEEEDEEDEDDDQMPGSSEKKERLKKKARDAGKKKVGGWSEKALMEAMDAIKNNSLTICKASRAYGIPRTTLRNWITGRTRSRKRGPHTGLPYEQSETSLEEFHYNEASEDLTTPDSVDRKTGKWPEQALLDAVDAVRSGSCTAAKLRPTGKYGINGVQKKSSSTEGRPEEEEGETKESDEKLSKKSNGWTEEALVNALEAIKNGFSIRKAGQQYGIPRTTLRNWLNGRTHSRKRGPHGGMTRGEQESAIVEWFFSIQQISQSLITLNSLRRRVATLSVNKGSPFKDGIPVKKWWVWFNRRHPDVAARVGDGLQQVQERNLINEEMSVVHMVTGEHLQILKRKFEGENEEDEKGEMAVVPREEAMESSSDVGDEQVGAGNDGDLEGHLEMGIPGVAEHVIV